MTENEELALEVEELTTALKFVMSQCVEMMAERDEDMRAVARVLAAESPRGGVDWAEWTASHAALRAHFADRIAELERRGVAQAANATGV